MLLILINTNYEDAVKYLIDKLGEGEAILITRSSILTWRSRGNVERAILSLKDRVISKVSSEGDIEFSFAIIELTEDQLSKLRTMVRDALVRLDKETYRHADAILHRANKMSEKRLETEMKFLNKRYESLMNIHNQFKIITPETERLIDLMKELRMVLRK